MVWFFTPPRRHPDQDRNMCRSVPCTKRCQLTTKCTLQQHAHIHISPVNSTPPPKKNKGGHPQLEPRPANRDAVQPEGTRPIQPRDTATGGANTGVRPGLDLPASAATTGVRPTQTEGRVANVTKGMRPVRYGQRTLVSVVEPLSGQPGGLSVGKGSSYAATDSYGDESSRQRT